MKHSRSRYLGAIIGAIALLMGTTPAKADTAASGPFPYPVVPDSIESLESRADYYITHFWDHADMKRVFSNRRQFSGAFSDYLSMMPHASAETVKASIDALLKGLQKQPRDLEFVGSLARTLLYSDSAAFWSDELFLPFAQAVAANKKVAAPTRRSMEQTAELLMSTRRGAQLKNSMITRPDGSNVAMIEPNDSVIFHIVMFNNPATGDADGARRRLDTDIVASKLIEAGLLTITSVYTGDPGDPVFATRLAPLTPQLWKLGALPDAASIYDLRLSPSFYILSGPGFLVEKNTDLEGALSVIHSLANRRFPARK